MARAAVRLGIAVAAAAVVALLLAGPFTPAAPLPGVLADAEKEPWFADVATDRGVNYTFHTTGGRVIGNDGVYVADYDRDGWTDLLAVGVAAPAGGLRRFACRGRSDRALVDCYIPCPAVVSAVAADRGSSASPSVVTQLVVVGRRRRSRSVGRTWLPRLGTPDRRSLSTIPEGDARRHSRV